MGRRWAHDTTVQCPSQPPRAAQHNHARLRTARLLRHPAPLGEGSNRVSDALGLLIFIGGVGGLTWLIWWQIRRYVAGLSSDAGGRVQGLLAMLYVVVVFFALFYYVLELNAPGQFEGIQTRTDALYFTAITLGTVGYGDIHAVGQIARAATMVQVAFDLVVIAALLAVASSNIARRVDRATRAGKATE